MARHGPNLPMLLATGGAALSAAVLGAVLLWRANSAAPGPDGGDPQVVSGPAEAGGSPETTRRAASSTEAILEATDELVRQSKLDRAEAVLRSAIGDAPEDQELRLALAGVSVMAEKLAGAYEQYEAALAIGPRTPDIEFTAGTVASRLNRLDRAEEHFSAAQAGDPSDPRFPLYLAQVQIKTRQIDAARKNLLLATRIDERLAIAWGTLAELSLRENDPNVALQLVARARALEPKVTAWRVIEARALNRMNQPDRALAVVLALPEEERRQMAVLRLIGESCGLLGEPSQAMREFEAAAAKDPENGELLFETAVWCERAGKALKARQYASRAAAHGVAAGADMAARLAAEADGG